MRGVYHGTCPHRPRAAGSSPHARGLRADGLHAAAPGRDHPRMRGVYIKVFSTSRATCGIIPACAGFTQYRGRTPRVEADHPRMRGVYPSSAVKSPKLAGSSPHARGLRGYAYQPNLASGIIPACAGFTSVRRSWTSAPRDHPRMRGVYLTPTIRTCSTPGSSPHARGLLDANNQDVLNARIIPACAGFTLFIAGGIRWWRDHPRMRGVYALTVIQFLLAPGSSPHARGLLVQAGKRQRSRRIIPACAGFTSQMPPSENAAKDHPRMRGVYIAFCPGR